MDSNNSGSLYSAFEEDHRMFGAGKEPVFSSSMHIRRVAVAALVFVAFCSNVGYLMLR